MIRLVIYLLILAAAAFGASWLADRPGELVLVWQGWRLETSILVAACVLIALMALAIFLFTLVRLILRSPDIVALAFRNRRTTKGWAAVSRGLVAVGSGDPAGAKRAAGEAQRLLGREPLVRLLAAQAAQLEGDRAGAEASFRAMLETPSTRLLGLRGLHVEARRRGDLAAALAAAEDAAKTDPGLTWAADAVIEARCATGDFAGALAVLEREAAHGGVERAVHRRRRAVLLAAEAQVLELSDPTAARDKALEAARLAPTFVPAVEVAGRLLGAHGDVKKAARLVETAYAANPHPDLASVYMHLRPGDAVRDRLKRVRTLVGKAPGHPESAIALAHGALDAHEFDTARTALTPLTETPTQRVCLLMAELEASEHGDVGKAREWTARAVRAARDPAWMADGVVADHWAPISPVTGKLDAFVWGVPPGVASTPMLEHEAERVKVAIAAAVESRRLADIAASPAMPAAAMAPVTPVIEPPAPKPTVEPIVALPHLPDDPGPDLVPDDSTAARRVPPFGV